MDLTFEELIKGKGTRIKDQSYYPTEAYVQPFFERMSKMTKDFRIKVELPKQMTLDGDDTDVTFNRVWIQAVLPNEMSVANHQQVIGLVYGLDCKKPIYKMYVGGLNMACTNLCVFQPEALEVREIEEGKYFNYRLLDNLISQTDEVSAMLNKMKSMTFDSDYRSTSEQLGNWIKRSKVEFINNGFGKVKIASSIPVSAYDLLYTNEKSPYFVGEADTDMFNVYNAFTQCITDSLKKDIMNQFEKTLLVSQILGL